MATATGALSVKINLPAPTELVFDDVDLSSSRSLPDSAVA